MKHLGGIRFFFPLYYNGISLVWGKLILKKCDTKKLESIPHLVYTFSFLAGFEANYKLNKTTHKTVQFRMKNKQMCKGNKGIKYKKRHKSEESNYFYWVLYLNLSL